MRQLWLRLRFAHLVWELRDKKSRYEWTALRLPAPRWTEDDWFIRLYPTGRQENP